jgi:hypothetical protein
MYRSSKKEDDLNLNEMPLLLLIVAWRGVAWRGVAFPMDGWMESRAMLYKRKIIVMDEPTGAKPNETETKRKRTT